MEGSKSVEALMLTLMEPTYLSKCFWYDDHHHQHHRHHHHRHHHHCHHHHQPQPKCAHIRPQSVGSKQQIPLENLSRRSALPKIELSTILTESVAAIVNTMVVRHREISSRWAH
jgi:hypothetical protein